MFDFCIKLIINGKIYLKVFQITNKKSDKQLKKYIKDIIIIFISYIKKKIEENNLGIVDFISFGFIISNDLYQTNLNDDKKEQQAYKMIESCCTDNGYDLLIYNIKSSKLFIEKNSELKEYDLFNERDSKNIDIIELKDIFIIKNNFRIVSLRNINTKVKDEKLEDDKVLTIVKNKYPNTSKVLRVGKFKFYGNFNDVEVLKDNYFFVFNISKNNLTIKFKEDNNNQSNNKNIKNESLTIVLFKFYILEKSNTENKILKEIDDLAKKDFALIGKKTKEPDK